MTALRVVWLLLSLLITVPGVSFAADTQTSLDSPLSKGFVIDFIAHLRAKQEILFRKEAAKPLVERFYKERDYRLVWFNSSGLSRQGQDLVAAIGSSSEHGLGQEHYFQAEFSSALEDIMLTFAQGVVPPFEEITRADVLLTRAYIAYGLDLLVGRINPATVKPGWEKLVLGTDLCAYLKSALDSDRITKSLELLAPAHKRYKSLREAMKHYQQIAAEGGWPRIENGVDIQPGMSNWRVPTIRRLLRVMGDYTDPADESIHYDTRMEQAVRRFQDRHNILVDGIVGAQTLQTMNIPVQVRLRQIALSLERWRWMPQVLGDDYIMVNVPGYLLTLVKDGEERFSTDVIIGTREDPTPSFSSRLERIVLNPSLQQPESIALPGLAPAPASSHESAPGYSADAGIRVYSYDTSGPLVQRALKGAAMPDLSQYYCFEPQEDGKAPRGRVQLVMPNPFNVSIYDTSMQMWFGLRERNSSKGCIRTAQPLELAMAVLQEEEGWSLQRLTALLNDAQDYEIALHSHAYTAHVIYMTAWVDAGGLTHFERDIYALDEFMEKLLSE